MTQAFLGMPAPLPPEPPRDPLQWGPTFPAAARGTLRNEQLRANLGRATHTIRDKRLRTTGELPDWEALREADAMARLPELLVELEEQVTARGGVVHWARTPPRPTGSSPTSRHRRDRGRQGQVHGHPGDRPQRAPGV